MNRMILAIIISLSLSSCIIYQDWHDQHDDTNALAWIRKSSLSIEDKNWSEAIRTASVAITIDPSYPEAYVNRATGYLEKGLLDKAFADCLKALELDNTHTGAYNIRGLVYLRREVREKAKVDLGIACNGGLKEGCDNFKIVVSFYLDKAEEAFNKKDWDGVIRYTSEVPNNEIALSVRSGAYAYKGMLKEAISDCDRAIKINPNYALPYNNKGFALELKGEKEEALLNYEIACNLKMQMGCDNMKRLTSSSAGLHK